MYPPSTPSVASHRQFQAARRASGPSEQGGGEALSATAGRTAGGATIIPLAPLLLEFYRARPPGVHAWHGESDPHDWRLDGIDDEDIDIDDDERDATAAAPAEAAGLAKAPARDEAAEEVKIPELVLLVLERREEVEIAVARLLLVRAGWLAD